MTNDDLLRLFAKYERMVTVHRSRRDYMLKDGIRKVHPIHKPWNGPFIDTLKTRRDEHYTHRFWKCDPYSFGFPNWKWKTPKQPNEDQP